jgi:hypothetical protein
MHTSVDEVLDNILAHHGIKGQKWGVRRLNPGRASGAVAVRTKVKPRAHMKTKVATRGGRGQPAVPEAIKAREKQQILKKSGVNALSDEDLRMLQNRLNLEQNVVRLSQTKVNKAGKDFVEQEAKKRGTAAIASASTKAGRAAIRKKMATGAAVLALA